MMAGEREREAGSLPHCLAQLRPQAEPGRRLRALLALRCKHLKEPGGAERFRRGGGLRALLGLLGPGAGGGGGGGRKELELGLSILGNCCTEERARREMGKLGGITPLVAILKGFSAVSVQNRAARALGNLALEGENSVAIHESGAVPHLIQLLSGTEDAECLQSVVRAVRILCDTPAHRRALTSQGCVAPLVGLLGREEPGLLGAATRATAELTRSCGAPCAQQLSRHGGIARLAALASHGKRAVREGALAALGNLCGQGFVRPSVGGAGGVGLLVEALRAEPGSSSAPAHLRALCLCCREAVNRARVRETGGLELLLALLKEPGHRVSHPRIIAAFVGFFYDQAAMDYLHTRGLIPVLVAKLVAVANLQHEPLPPGAALPHHRHPLLPAPHPDEPEDARQSASFDFPSDCDHRIDGELQPEASSSFLSLRSWLVSEGYIESPGELSPGRCAPCGGGEMESSFRLMQSPGERAEEEEDRGLAERPGEASESSSGGGVVSGSRSGLVLTLPSDPLPSPTTPEGPSPSPEPCGPEAPILLLLSRFSQAEDPAPSLLSERSLRGLLDYLTLARLPSPRCARLLARLACNPNCLEALVRARAVPLVRAQLVHGLGPGALLDGTGSAGGGAGARKSGALTPSGIGTTRRNRELGEVLLRNLSVQAESPFGMGALTHLLLSGSESEKTACAIALPLLCRNETLRRKLLVDHGGLHLLLETLLTSGEPVATFGAVDAMATMAGAPGEGPEPACKRPRTEEGEVAEEKEGGVVPPRCLYRELVCRGATDMHFVLDGGERLAASRGHVSRGSEVFGAMLGGGYLESRQSAVPLRGLAPDVCSLFLHHLHGCQATAGCPAVARLGEEEEQEAGPPFEASLLGRALAAAGQFLLSDLVAQLEEAACSRQLPARLPTLYHFAERHHCPGLRARCLRGLLEAPMGVRERAGAWGRLAEGARDPPALLSALHSLLLEHV